MFPLKNKRKKSDLIKMGSKLITVSDTKSIISEQFRTIRANIKYSVPDLELKTILITSSSPGEGKSTTASNLGVVFAQEGKKVLMVDADLRKPTLHHIFGLFNTVGLSTILSKQNDISHAIQNTPILGLYLLPSGPIPPNPAELLSSKNLVSFIEEVKNLYDVIIFDTPPLLSVSDAKILSHHCDSSLLIVHSGAEKEEVLEAQAMLASSQSKFLGIILNKQKMPKKRKYYLHYYN